MENMNLSYSVKLAALNYNIFRRIGDNLYSYIQVARTEFLIDNILCSLKQQPN